MSEKKRIYDIIIPVYGALPYLRQCINSLLENTKHPYNLVIVDDGNGPIIKEYLKTIRSARIITNKKNLGWLKSCNIGIENTKNDVVLLNSDTLVTKGWLEKMDRAAYISSRTGMVNPLTNNALFLSIPHSLTFNSIPAGFTLKTFSNLVSELSERRYPSIPVAYGFCLLIKREIFDQIGLFDERFELGYGEEYDFFMRAKRKGYKAICCDDAFVYHYGWKSFGDSPYMTVYRMRVDGKYPDCRVKYYESINRFDRNNPLSYLRTKLLIKISEISSEYGKNKISIIMPVYNRERYLEEAVKSVLGQSYSNFELIIVDDGSTDNSLNIAREFAEQDKRVTVITLKEHKGIAVARNEGLRRARGGFITQLDSDDVMLPDAIKSRVQFLNSHPEVDFVFGKIHRFIDKEGNPIENNYSQEVKQFYRMEKNYNFYERVRKLALPIPNVNSTSMFRRDVFFRSGYYEESLPPAEDKDFSFRIMRESNISYLDEPIIFYRMHDSNLSGMINKETGEWVARPENISEFLYRQELLVHNRREIERPKKVCRGVRLLNVKDGGMLMKKKEYFSKESIRKFDSGDNCMLEGPPQVELLLGQIGYMAELIDRLRLEIKRQRLVIVVKDRYIHSVGRIVEGRYQYIINIIACGFGHRIKKLISTLTKRENSTDETEETYRNKNYLRYDLIRQIEYMAGQIDLLRSKIETQRVAMIAKDHHINNLNNIIEGGNGFIFELVRRLNRIKEHFDDKGRKVWRRLRGI